MAKIQFLTILLVATCFLGGVVSVTDKEFEALSDHVQHLTEILENQLIMNLQLRNENVAKSQELRQISLVLRQQDTVIKQLTGKCNRNDGVTYDKDSARNGTIEERVAILELQVSDLEGSVIDLDEDVDFLFDEPVIQDERLLGLEQGINVIESDLDVIDDELESLQDTTLALDFRVTVLEENGGGNGNSSVAELEVRVETLEGTTADHETRISTESDVADLVGAVADQETRLTAAEENIQALQMTDVELDERVTNLEENNLTDTVAFHTALTDYSSIPIGSAVEFNEVLLNEGDGYDSSTGTFTVPPGGDGFYYFSAYMRVFGAEFANFNIEINGELICSVTADIQGSSSTDREITSCSGATYATEGNEIQVVYITGTDTNPLVATSSYYHVGFTGFRI